MPPARAAREDYLVTGPLIRRAGWCCAGLPGSRRCDRSGDRNRRPVPTGRRRYLCTGRAQRVHRV